LTYAQVAELTWPQLMHAMGIDPNAREDDSASRFSTRSRRAEDACRLICCGYRLGI
jgi:hypothetical protein